MRCVGQAKERKIQHILIVEDEELVLLLLAAFLRNEDYHVSSAGNAAEMYATLNAEAVDLVVLDLGLPDEDGLVLVRQLRARSDIPIIILTSRTDQESRLAALELGADDYLVKNCEPQELLLRIQNLLRRSSGLEVDGVIQGELNRIEFDEWTLDFNARSLLDPDGSEVALSRGEFNLLAALTHAPNRALNRGQLLDAVTHNADTPSERMIDVSVARLRQKIEVDSRNPRLITTMVGVGYKFVAKVTRT